MSSEQWKKCQRARFALTWGWSGSGCWTGWWSLWWRFFCSSGWQPHFLLSRSWCRLEMLSCILEREWTVCCCKMQKQSGLPVWISAVSQTLAIQTLRLIDNFRLLPQQLPATPLLNLRACFTWSLGADAWGKRVWSHDHFLVLLIFAKTKAGLSSFNCLSVFGCYSDFHSQLERWQVAARKKPFS